MPFENIRCYDVTDSSFASGAAGNGIHDDAPAIQAAIDAIKTDYGNVGYDTPDTNAYLRTTPVLYFPPGRYRISQTLSFLNGLSVLTIRGDDAIILPHCDFSNEDFDSADWAIEIEQSYKYKIEGLSFLKFHKAVSIDTSAVDTSQLTINSCVFQDSSLALQLACQNSVTVVEKSKFFNNIQAIKILEGEKITVKDNWFTAAVLPSLDPCDYPAQYANFRPCQIENHGVLYFEDNLLVPKLPATGAIEPAWINNYLYVKAVNIRQGGDVSDEPSAGSFTLINNFAATSLPVSNSGTQTGVIVKDSHCYAVYGNIARSPNGFLYTQPAVVRLIQVPNLTVIKNNVGLIDCKIIDYSLYEYVDSVDPYAFDLTKIANMITASNATPGITVMEVANNSGPYLFPQGTSQKPQASYVPELLYPFVRTDESLWPYRRRPMLPQKNPTISGSVSTFHFDVADGFFSGLRDKTFLLRFNGDPVYGGGGWYSGGVVGILRIIGTFDYPNIKYILSFTELVNQRATSSLTTPNTFGVAIKWNTTNSNWLIYNPSSPTTDQQFVVEITGADGNQSLDLIILDDL